MTDKDVKKSRIGLELSQTEFGKMLGVGIRAVQKWEKGEIQIPKTAQILLDMILSKSENISYSIKEPEPTYTFKTLSDFSVDEKIQDLYLNMDKPEYQNNLTFRMFVEIVSKREVVKELRLKESS